MDRLDLDPPIALLEGIPDQVRIVAVAYDELVAVLNVGVFERDFAHGSFEHVGVATA